MILIQKTATLVVQHKDAPYGVYNVDLESGRWYFANMEEKEENCNQEDADCIIKFNPKRFENLNVQPAPELYHKNEIINWEDIMLNAF
jgi:hypothetical protein